LLYNAPPPLFQIVRLKPQTSISRRNLCTASTQIHQYKRKNNKKERDVTATD
jgi:hypothetical protein